MGDIVAESELEFGLIFSPKLLLLLCGKAFGGEKELSEGGKESDRAF